MTEQLLNEGYPIQISPKGDSMRPFIRPNVDSVIIEPIKNQRIKRGDVILFRRLNSILVLHRVHHIHGNDYFLVGDNQVQIEGPVKKEQIKGKLTVIIRDGRRIPVTNPFYRCISFLWLILRPIRPIIGKINQRLRK